MMLIELDFRSSISLANARVDYEVGKSVGRQAGR